MFRKLLIVSTLAMLPVITGPAKAQSNVDKLYACYESCVYAGSGPDWCSAECTRLFDNEKSGGGDPNIVPLPVTPCRNNDCNNVRPN